MFAAASGVHSHHRPLIALGAGLLAFVFIGTALFRVCPLYTLLRVNTCPRSTLPH